MRGYALDSKTAAALWKKSEEMVGESFQDKTIKLQARSGQGRDRDAIDRQGAGRLRSRGRVAIEDESRVWIVGTPSRRAGTRALRFTPCDRADLRQIRSRVDSLKTLARMVLTFCAFASFRELILPPGPHGQADHGALKTALACLICSSSSQRRYSSVTRSLAVFRSASNVA